LTVMISVNQKTVVTDPFGIQLTIFLKGRFNLLLCGFAYQTKFAETASNSQVDMKLEKFIPIFICLLLFVGIVYGKETGNLFPVKKDGKFGYIDSNGKVIIPFKFDDAWYFSEGLASIKIGEKRGYINEKGKIVIEPQFVWANSFFEGLAKVETSDSFGLTGFIDKSGKIVIKPEFRQVDHFSDGLALVQIDSKYGYIDKLGKTVITPQFSYAHPFLDGLACVQVEEK
jgi:WG containing repeat